MLDMSTDQKIAIDEVAFNILRMGLSELGYTCDHSNVGWSQNSQQPHPMPYCKNCYSRLELVSKKTYFKGKILTQEVYEPLETFIDREHKELKQKAKDEEEIRKSNLLNKEIGNEL
jgi:hypothetical protein